jgi:hypothetical protein
MGFAEEYQKRVDAEVCEGAEVTDLGGVAVVGLLLWKRLRF